MSTQTDDHLIKENVEEIEVINPATGEVIGRVPKGGKKEAQEAVEAAHAAFPLWSERTAYDRGLLLEKWFQLIEENKQELAVLVTKETGKPLSESLGEVDYGNGYVKWYAEEGKRIYGETIPASVPNKKLIVQKQPIGVVAAITPWNYPLTTVTRKVATALAAGCTIVLKPDEKTPLTALKLIELADKAGLPKGVVTLVIGNPQEIGQTWMDDGRVRKITFTGSTEVGKLLMRGSANTIKKLSLELGGNAPFLVMEDANVDNAVQQLVRSKFRNAGQTCVCANRVFVHESIAEVFQEKFSQCVRALNVGNGLDDGIEIGPLIDTNAIHKVEKHIQDAVQKGAQVLAGGKKIKDLYFEPTVLANVTDDMLCMAEETFGPLAPITTFKTEEEAIERANAIPLGLATYVMTENIGSAIRISEKLEYGIVGINDGLPSTPQAPFGGWKESGVGREGGHHGLDDYLEIKYISLAY